jgi:hypothetical protein
MLMMMFLRQQNYACLLSICLLQPKGKEDEKKTGEGEKVGSGRAIPLKQVYIIISCNETDSPFAYQWIIIFLCPR